jgi:hypothetical protein
LLLLTVWLAWAAPAPAYVLQGPHILELMVKGLGRAKSLQASQDVVVYDTDALHVSSRLTETVHYRFPHQFRSEMRADGLERIQVFNGGRSLTIINGQVAAGSGETRYDLYKDLLLLRSRRHLHDRLLRLGVAVDVSSLGRLKEQVAFVVGATYPDESRPQVWFDLDTFRPLRWIVTAAGEHGARETFEVHYRRWESSGDKWYPRRIEFYAGARLLREIRVTAAHWNPDRAVEASLFDVERLKALYPQREAGWPQSPANDEIEEVQKGIEEFRRILEP